MKKKIDAVTIPLAILVLTLIFSAGRCLAATRTRQPQVNPAVCYACHEQIEALHAKGKHARVACANCHGETGKHAAAPGDVRPTTDTSWEACGKCHREQYASGFKVSYARPGRDEKSRLTGRSPNPFWDKLMMGHGFTKEHGLTRSHPWMLVDHLLVDRAYGGRFQPKKGWEYTTASPRTKTWDLVEDRYPEVKEQKTFLPQTAASANAVCLQCKSQDHILDWAYKGDPASGAR